MKTEDRRGGRAVSREVVNLSRAVVRQQQCRELFAARFVETRGSRAGTLLALGVGVRPAMLLLLLLLGAMACAPARVLAGGGAVAAGIGVTHAALGAMTASCPEQGNAGQVCPDRYSPTPPRVAMQGIAHRRRSRAVPLARSVPPDVPVPSVLDEAGAVGMAVARLSLTGITLHSRPSKLVRVDDTSTRFRVHGGQAELWNLRVRSSSDSSWRSLYACYEQNGQWRLVRLATTPGCPRR
jgi:hypothetical protein